MSAFNFVDFTIFAGISNVKEDTYITIAKGVISYINKHYGIYPEVESITLKEFLSSGQLSITPTVHPITSIDTLTYDGDVIDDTTYSYYGEDILMDTALDDIRKPLYIDLTLGYTSVPDDLILAVYRHMLAVYFSIDKHTDNITKTINSEGNTTYFTSDVVPPASKQIYEFYAGSTLLVS